MYKDLKSYYWWSGLNREIVEYVVKYTVCQQVKVNHQRFAGELQPLSISEWK